MKAAQHRVWYLNPYTQLFLAALAIAAAEIFLKKGATIAQEVSGSSVLGLDALSHTATWFGIGFHIMGFVMWLMVLRILPLSEAFALINVVHVLVPLASAHFLKENVSMTQAAGVGLILIGTYFVAGAAARGEEKL